MSVQRGGNDISLEAGEDLSSSQYYILKPSGDGQVSAAGANAVSVGILQNEPESGEAAMVRIGGVSKFICSEAVSVGDRVTPTSNGKGEIVDAADEFAVGICVTSTSTDGDIGELVIAPHVARSSDA